MLHSFNLAPNHDIRGLLLFTWATWASTRCARSAPPNRLSRSSITSLYNWLLQLGCSNCFNWYCQCCCTFNALSMHSKTHNNTKYQVLDVRWDGEERLDGECLSSLHVYPWMFFHPIGMYNLHPNDPIAFMFSPVIPLAKFKSMGKNTKVLVMEWTMSRDWVF